MKLLVLTSMLCLVHCQQHRQENVVRQDQFARQEKVVRHGIFVTPISKLETASPMLNLKKKIVENVKPQKNGGSSRRDEGNDGNLNERFNLNRTKVYTKTL